MRELGGIAVALLALSTPGGSAPEIHEKTTFYDVAGRTAEQLRDAMDREGPLASDGRRVRAHASWKVRYTYEPVVGNDGCALKQLSVTADISTILPRWVDKPRTTSALTDRWEEYLAALSSDMKGIQEIGRRAAATLQESVWKVSKQPQCAALAKMIGDTAGAVIEKHVRQTEEYEKALKADRGKGARFP